MDALERLRQSPLPFAALLGIEFTAARQNRSRRNLLCAMTMHPAGRLHGGAIMAFADTLGAAATMLNLAEGAGPTTIESKTNFIAPAPVGSKILARQCRFIAGGAPRSGKPKSRMRRGAWLPW